MGAIVVVAIIISLFTLWGFLKLEPAYAEKQQLKTFNLMVLGVVGVFCLLWYINVRTYLVNYKLEVYVPLFGIGGAMVVATVFLIIFFFIRNFWIFKPPPRGGGYY